MTWHEMWIGFGVFFWIIGYVRVGRVRENDLLVDRTFVRPPFVIYLVCGMPRARNIPKGVMAIPSLFGQLQGLFWILYGLIFHICQVKNLFVQGSIFLIGMVLTMVYVLTLYERRAYKVE